MNGLFSQVLDIAADQHGFVTTEDARCAGIDPTQLRLLLSRGQIERRSQGVYFVPQFGIDDLTEYQEAVLWAKGRGVIAGESALALWQLADVNPRRIRLVVPPDYNPRKRGQERYRVERRRLPAGDVTAVEGVPVTTAERAIRDAAASGTAPGLSRQAVDSALQRGLITAGETRKLRREIGASRLAS